MLVDQFGYALTNKKFATAVQRSPQQVNEPNRNYDFDKLVPDWDRVQLLSLSRKMFFNHGAIKTAINQKANLSIGKSWLAKYTGEDREWGMQAEEWLKNWYSICNVRGPMFDLQTSLHLGSISVDRDGDYFILLTAAESGYPQIQMIGAHRVGQRDNQKDRVESGPYKGLRICQGVIKNKLDRPVAYRILGDKKDDGTFNDVDVSARDLIQVFNPLWFEQSRGTCAGAHSLDKMMRALKSEEWEEIAMMMISSMALIEYNEKGGIDEDDPSNYLIGNATDGEGITTQTIDGGRIKYFKSNSGSKLEAITHDRPGDIWEKFQDRAIRTMISGMDWSYAYAWKSAELTGTSVRVELEKVRSAVEDRQELLQLPTKRVITYAIAKAIKSGILPQNDDWYKWNFTLPPKVSIDGGRDSVAKMNEWRSGAINMTELVAERGKSIDDHYLERAREVALRKRIQQEVETETGIKIEDREMSMLNVNEMPENSEGADVAFNS